MVYLNDVVLTRTWPTSQLPNPLARDDATNGLDPYSSADEGMNRSDQRRDIAAKDMHCACESLKLGASSAAGQLRSSSLSPSPPPAPAHKRQRRSQSPAEAMRMLPSQLVDIPAPAYFVPSSQPEEDDQLHGLDWLGSNSQSHAATQTHDPIDVQKSSAGVSSVDTPSHVTSSHRNAPVFQSDQVALSNKTLPATELIYLASRTSSRLHWEPRTRRHGER